MQLAPQVFTSSDAKTQSPTSSLSLLGKGIPAHQADHNTVSWKAKSRLGTMHKPLHSSHYCFDVCTEKSGKFARRCTIGLNVALMVLFLSLAITFFLLAAGQQNKRALKVRAA